MTPDLNSRGHPLGRAVLLFAAELISEMCKGRHELGNIRVIDNRIPEDAVVVFKYYDPKRDCFAIVLESESFAPVPEGCMLPILTSPIFQSRLP